jgi:hypothetical protein
MEDYELCYLSVGRDLLRFGATQTLVQPTDSWSSQTPITTYRIPT